jgi:cardiolipin synthase
VLFIIKELFQLALGAVNLSRGKMLPGALMTGKICTTVLFISLTGLVIFPDVGDSSVQFIAMVNASFLMISFISHLSAYLGSNPRTQNLE